MDLEDYGPLFEGAVSEIKLQDIVLKICDAHLYEALYEPSVEEFWTPFDLIPVEIICILKEFGDKLDLSGLRHSMLYPGFIQGPGKIKSIEWPLLKRLGKKLESLWPKNLSFPKELFQ